MRSRRRRPAEIGHGKNHAELAAFTGDFIEGYGGGNETERLLGGGRLKNAVRRFQTTFGICRVLTQPTLAK